jgi:glycosyltransferase involved in cell wall biosynthesis
MNRSQKDVTSHAPRRVGVVVPAHNEAAVIDGCTAALERSADVARRQGHEVLIYVVCDSCSDDTRERVLAAGLSALQIDARNVGMARAVGAATAMAAGAQWLAFTDADSIVSDTWILDQLDLGSDAFCGTVAVTDWGHYGHRMKEHFLATYTDAEDHRHIHGANFGISVAAYQAVGGFQSLDCDEDVSLVRALEAASFDIAWSAKPRVTTSARTDYRVPRGFGATLQRVASGFRVEEPRRHLAALMPAPG